jgi:hypothetical protein
MNTTDLEANREKLEIAVVHQEVSSEEGAVEAIRVLED